MSVEKAYDQWASQYDSNENRTRDLEARSLRETLSGIEFESCLELGCGTGKNSEWLAARTKDLLAVDLSEEMLARAKAKITEPHVRFQQVNLLGEWSFVDKEYELAVFSLVLEHIEDLAEVFRKLAKAVKPGGYVYVGELHPFKQYTGSKARYETENGTEVVTCYDHHLSDFTMAGEASGFRVAALREYFDGEGREGMPRILMILFQREFA